MDYKIVFLDIDGTILPPNHIIQESTKQAVKKLQEKGIMVVIATGRTLADTVKIADQLHIASYISFNGGYAFHEGKELVKKPFDSAFVNYIVKESIEENYDAFLLTFDGTFAVTPSSPLTQSFSSKLDLALFDFADLDNRDVYGITIATPKAYEKTFDEIAVVETSVGLDYAYDLLPKHTNKATAIQEFLTKINVSPCDAVAFGDGMNDKEMLSYVGMGVAMGNASLTLKSYADMVTTSVENHGIYNGLKEIGLL